MTTDNGRNFVKAFVHFGEESVKMPDLSVAENLNINREDTAVDALLSESSNEEELETIALTDTIAVPNTDNYIKLPAHIRCAAHSFNLVATKDAEAALHNSILKLPFRTAMSKARALWNLQDRSTVAADKIYAEIGKRLKTPNTTRWNSTYDSVEVLNKILENTIEKSALYRAMTHLKINSFNDSDIILLAEYMKVINLL